MPSEMKQIRLPVTPEQEAVLTKLRGKQKTADYIRALIEADAKSRGLDFPQLDNQHGGNRKKTKS